MQNLKDINVAATGKITLKEVVQKLLNIKPSDREGCPKGALVVKYFGGCMKTKIHLCNMENPPCAYFKRTGETSTPFYLGSDPKRYTLCPNH